MSYKLLVIIAGPTAVGKTDLCIDLAKQLNTAIISADSRQFYREMSIGTAKPTIEDLSIVDHYLINTHSIHQEISAGQYEEQAISLIEKLFLQKDVLILTGGSGLFIDAVIHGFDPMPAVDPALRDALNKELEIKGLKGLLEELKEKDREYYDLVDKNNYRRVIRAIEVIRSTGAKYSEQRKGIKKNRNFQVLKIGLERERKELYERINHRVEIMVQNGLIEEARSLYPFRHLATLKTVGYSELFDYFEGKYDQSEAISLIKRNSRRYAKRQLTWFKRDEAIVWFHPDQMQLILQLVMEKLKPLNKEIKD